MSRTYRNNPSVKFEYESGVAFHVQRGPFLWAYSHWHLLSKGGWNEAKRVLSKEDYAELRKLRGDKFTGYFANGGVPHWYRNELEKQLRHHTKRELHRFMRNSEYEVMAMEEPSGDEWYYW